MAVYFAYHAEVLITEPKVTKINNAKKRIDKQEKLMCHCLFKDVKFSFAAVIYQYLDVLHNKPVSRRRNIEKGMCEVFITVEFRHMIFEVDEKPLKIFSWSGLN